MWSYNPANAAWSHPVEALDDDPSLFLLLDGHVDGSDVMNLFNGCVYRRILNLEDGKLECFSLSSRMNCYSEQHL